MLQPVCAGILRRSSFSSTEGQNNPVVAAFNLASERRPLVALRLIAFLKLGVKCLSDFKCLISLSLSRCLSAISWVLIPRIFARVSPCRCPYFEQPPPSPPCSYPPDISDGVMYNHSGQRIVNSSFFSFLFHPQGSRGASEGKVVGSL